MKQTASLVLAILALGVRADVNLAVYAIDGAVKAECALKDEVWQEVRAVFDRGIELRHRVQRSHRAPISVWLTLTEAVKSSVGSPARSRRQRVAAE